MTKRINGRCYADTIFFSTLCPLMRYASLYTLNFSAFSDRTCSVTKMVSLFREQSSPAMCLGAVIQHSDPVLQFQVLTLCLCGFGRLAESAVKEGIVCIKVMPMVD